MLKMGRQACQELGEECFRLREQHSRGPKRGKKKFAVGPRYQNVARGAGAPEREEGQRRRLE